MATPPAEESKEAKADFYEYLYNEKKEPTKTLDALLRAIALYIVGL